MRSESNNPSKLSVVIITFNEESKIGACIDSVRPIADEILVVDSYSTDQTKKICEERGVRFSERAFEGYGAQKNYAAAIAQHDLILSIDADERPDSALIEAINRVKANLQYDVYSMNRLNCYCGKWIRHGAWYPDVKMRLYNRQKGDWSLSNVHETFLPANGAAVGHLPGNLLHYSYDQIEQHRRQIEKYSTLGAKEAQRLGKKAGFAKRFVNPAWRFFRDYVLRMGFLDGYYGWVIAKLTAREVYLKYRKLGELNKKLA